MKGKLTVNKHAEVSSRPSDVLRVAVIGCGAIAEQMHLPVLAGHEHLKLTALVDRDLGRAKRLALGYGVEHVFTDASSLTRDLVDAAIVATPAFHHAPCTIDLVTRGIHVLVEKPMATTYADAVRMVEASEKAGVALSVGYFRRLYPSIRLLKGLLDSGWAGRPLRFLIEGGGMYSWPAATLGNMKRDLAGGGVLIDFGSHMVDLMFALFDEPAEVLEYRDNALGGVESDCSIRVTAQHGGRSVDGRIELARTREMGNLVRVECERATFEFLVNERFQVRVVLHGTELTDPASGKKQPFWLDAAWQREVKDEPWYATFGRQFEDWVTAIRTGQPPILSGRSALRTAQFIDTCYRQPGRIEEPWVSEGVVGHAPRLAGKNRRRKILVTGANGFIGCRVAEILRLREGCDVRAVVHNPGNASRLARLDIEMVQADIGSPDDARRLVDGCDAVVHCAIGTDWVSSKVLRVTVDGTRHLAESALRAKVARFVHVSTMSVYGDDGELTGILDETTAVRPAQGSVYGESKAAAERIVLDFAKKGLPAVVFRPARVFGAFSRTFIIRPLQAIAEGRFEWLGTPDVPCDMVYVDNVVEALLAALVADDGKVVGQAFNTGDQDPSTWRAFYQYFADAQGLDLGRVPVSSGANVARKSPIGRALAWPKSVVHGIGAIATSSEFKAFGGRVLRTDPIGTVPRKALGRYPALEAAVRRMVGADDSLPVYQPQPVASGDIVQMGSGGAVLSIDKLRTVMGFEPPLTHRRGMELTLDWVRHARIVGGS